MCQYCENNESIYIISKFIIGSLTWSTLYATGNRPAARYEHSAFKIPGRRQVGVFAGANQERNFNDLHILDLGNTLNLKSKNFCLHCIIKIH